MIDESVFTEPRASELDKERANRCSNQLTYDCHNAVVTESHQVKCRIHKDLPRLTLLRVLRGGSAVKCHSCMDFNGEE